MAQQKGTIIIEKLFGGFASDKSSQNTKAVFGKDGQYSQGQSVCFFRPGYEGHMAPGIVFNTMSDPGGLITGLPLNGVVQSDGEAFVVQDNGKIVWWNVGLANSGPEITIGSNNFYLPTGSVSSGNNDIAWYPAQVGTTPNYTPHNYIFESWENSSQGDVARIEIANYGATTVGTLPNYLTNLGTQQNGTALFKGVPHPLVIGQDNKLYVGNGHYVAQNDLTVGSTVNYAALDIAPGWTIVSLAKYQDSIAIAAYKQGTSQSTGYPKSESKVFLWDGFSPSWNSQNELQDNYVSNIFYDGADLFAITYGRNATTKLKKYNGYLNKFQTLAESGLIGQPPGGQVSNTPCTGGMDLWLNHLVWSSGNSARINAFGSPDTDKDAGLHNIALVNSSNGMVKNLAGNQLFIGNKTGGGTCSIQYSDLTKYDQQAQLRSQLYELPTNSQIDNLKFYFSQFGSGADLLVGAMKDYANATVGSLPDQLQLEISLTNNASVGSTMYYAASTFAGDNSNYNSFYLQVDWNHNASHLTTAAIIRKVEVNYQYDDDNI